MKKKSNQKILNCILAAVFIFCAVIVITDSADTLLGIPQWSFNIVTFFAIIPLCLGLSDIVERLHPEFFDNDDD